MSNLIRSIFGAKPTKRSAPSSALIPGSERLPELSGSALGVDLSLRALHDRLEAAKRAFTTRRVDLQVTAGLSRTLTPRAGDLVLATVSEVGHHGRIELPSGRRAQLYPGDEIIVAYGARYAPDQFEAVVPKVFGPCALVAGGGVAAQMLAKHARVRKPTAITPTGILTDASGGAVNVRRFALPVVPAHGAARNVIAVVGTSMNAGKTTLAASLIRGLTRCGMRVGACKVTGTGSGGDMWSMLDAGAVQMLDFTDAGYATTSGLEAPVVDRVAHNLVSHLEASDVDIVVVEIADGLLQRETSALLSPPSSFAKRLDAVVLAAADAMGACSGVQWLASRDLPLRAVSGLVTASPLAAREAREACGAEVIDTRALCEPEHAGRLALQQVQLHCVGA